MTNLTPIVNLIVKLTYLLVVIFLIPFLKAKLSESQRNKLKLYVKMAVQAAEMLWSDPGMGLAKKNYVKEYLESKGYTLDTYDLDVLIESAVLELKNP